MLRNLLALLFKMFGNIYEQAFDCNLSSVNFFVCFPPIVQVLKAKVLQCDPDKSKMVLSFKAAVEGVTEAPPKPEFDCEVGKVSSRPFLYFYFFFLYPNL